MIKIKNNYHKKLTFPTIGIVIDAGETMKISNKDASILNNKWISQIQSNDKQGRKNINKKYNSK